MELVATKSATEDSLNKTTSDLAASPLVTSLFSSSLIFQ